MLIQLIFIYSVQSWPALSLNSALSPTARNQGKTKISLLMRRILLKRSESITVPTHTVQYIIYLTPICWWPLISFVSLPGGIIFTTATVHTWKLSPPLPLGWSDLIFVVEIFQNGHVASDKILNICKCLPFTSKNNWRKENLGKQIVFEFYFRFSKWAKLFRPGLRKN